MSGWQKIIGWGYNLLFILVPLIWLPNTSELFEFNKIIVTYILTIIIVGAWMTQCITEKKIIFKRTLLDIPILIFLLSTLVSTLFSLDMHTSFYGYYSRWNGGLLSLLSYALLYWAFVSNMDSKSALRTTHYALLTSIAVAIYGSLEHFGLSPSCILTRGQWGVDCWVQDVQNRVFTTLGQPNWMAAYLTALIWIPVSKLLKSQILNSKLQINHKSKKIEGLVFRNYLGFSILNLVFFILLFAALLFTKSRSGLLAFGVSTAVYAALQYKIHKSKFMKLPRAYARGIFSLSLRRERNPSEAKRLRFHPPAYAGGFSRRGINHALILTTCCLLLLAVIPNPIRDVVIKSTSPAAPVGPALETGGTESGAIRKIVWTGALRIWQANTENFLIGTGPETFAESYYQYRPIEHNQTSEWELLYNKAHNEYLNYLATTGLLGLVSYIVLLISMVIVISSQTNQLTAAALLAGWISITVTNFWGFSVVIVQLFLFLFPAIAIILNEKS